MFLNLPSTLLLSDRAMPILFLKTESLVEDDYIFLSHPIKTDSKRNVLGSKLVICKKVFIQSKPNFV